MNKTASGLEIIKEADSTIQGKRVSLTRKTNKAGEIRHGVVLTNTRNGHHHRIGEVETQIVNAGFLTWDEVETAEIASYTA